VSKAAVSFLAKVY